MELPSPDIKSIDNALFIEHHVQRIITKQEQNGVQFNSTRAKFYVHALREKQAMLYRKIRPYLSLQLTSPFDRPVSRPYLKSGEYSAPVKKWFGEEEIHCVGGPFTRIAYVEPDLGKRQQLVAQLMQLGWKPVAFTEKGNPKLTVEGEPCESLRSIGSEIGQWIADWYTYRHRESQIAGWLERVRSDGRIEARAITIGTPTFRFRHSGVVNVPKAAKQVLFGRQMRSLFGCRKGYRLVGYDASGLELRMLADVINDEEYTYIVVHGDPHTKNQNDAGLPNRDNAKTFIYAFIYGAGDAKIGVIVGGSRVAGKRIKQKFLAANPKLAKAISDTQAAARRGYLVGIDGRKITMRRDKFTGEIQVHKALNTRLQCAGAVVMKWAMVILDEWIDQYNLDAPKVIDMHDEGQHEVRLDHVQLFRTLAPLSIVTAGQMLQLNVPLAGEAKVGLNWAHTH
jgi:DNA polymerase I-like protein with 3'-5' exonuclease and polymerase domains